MASTNFINQQTVIQADWLNDVNTTIYNLLGNGTTIPASKSALLTSLGGLSSANNLSDLGSVATARTNLGVTGTGADTTYLFRSNNLSDLANTTTARTNLGLGTIATQASNNVTITGGSITGITDLAVADGGTGSSTLSANAVLLGNGTSALQTVAPGASGNVLTSNGTTWTSAASTASSVTLGTPQTLPPSPTNTEVVFTGIPSTVREVYINLSDVSFATTAAALRIQIGGSSIENTGYVSATTRLSGSSVTSDPGATAGFDIQQSYGITNSLSGTVSLKLISSASNLWSCTFTLADTTAGFLFILAGRKATSSGLTTVRITSAAGGIAFDAGTINISYS